MSGETAITSTAQVVQAGRIAMRGNIDADGRGAQSHENLGRQTITLIMMTSVAGGDRPAGTKRRDEMRKPMGLGLTRGASAPRGQMEEMAEEMPDDYGGHEELEADPYDPAPRKPNYPDQGGPDFDPTDPKQKPKNYDGYTDAARREAQGVKDAKGMMEWRRRWLQRAKEAGLTEQQASQALDDIEDSL